MPRTPLSRRSGSSRAPSSRSRADERLPLDDLYQATETIAATLAELLGG